MIVGFIDKDMGVKVYDISLGKASIKKMKVGDVEVLPGLAGNMLMGSGRGHPRDYSSVERVEVWLEEMGFNEMGDCIYKRIEI